MIIFMSKSKYFLENIKENIPQNKVLTFNELTYYRIKVTYSKA